MASDGLDVNATEEAAGGYVHATAIVVCESGVLIRGASGAGKSRLAALLLAEAERRKTFARLVSDDRVALTTCDGRLLARAHPALVGLIERRFEGIVSMPHEPVCVVNHVIDLVDERQPRLPDVEDCRLDLLGIAVARFTLATGLPDVDAPSVLDRLMRDRGRELAN